MKTASSGQFFRFTDTPMGPLRLAFSPRGLAAVEFWDAGAPLAPAASPPASLAPMVEHTLQALEDYFAGTPSDFSTLSLDLQGTPFQLRVWQELRRIPWGATVSYQELAQSLGRPQAARAVGQACGANPIPIIIPCHRVVAADGSLGGFSSGLAHKRWLLKHEGVKGQKAKG
jgi:methylated-DNA-[protein]-cysteine S-methyltransferase